MTKLNKNWLHQHLSDPYVKLAQKEGYRARAVYKLKEIDEAEKLIRARQVIVDLGCSPGSWSQYVRHCLHEQGALRESCIIGLDLLPMKPIADVHFILGDFCHAETLKRLEDTLQGRKIDLVLSDMAPSLSGIHSADAARVDEIIELALDFSRVHLSSTGTLLAKFFQGMGEEMAIKGFRKQFSKVLIKKPKASRAKSPEMFLLGRNLKSHIGV